jgi:dTDP-glucose 4,6-dehydratase
MNLLVTGGAGFIGSNLIRLIIDRPRVEKLVNLDALTYAGNLQNLAGIHDQHPRYHFEHVDLRDASEVHRVAQQHDITHVIHLAAESHVDRSIASAGIFMETNVLGTLNLLDACRAQWGDVPSDGLPRFIHVSTDEVYGSLGFEDAPFTEESPLLPNSPYAASKAAADCLVRSYVQTYGYPAAITRCCNNYGPNQYSEKFIPTVLRCLRDSRPIPVYGNGQNVREWIHVEDHAEALWAVLQKGQLGAVYNIGSGEEMPNLDLVRTFCSLADEAKNSCPGHHLKLLSFVSDRPGHDLRYAVDTAKLREQTEWKSVLPLAEGLRSRALPLLAGSRGCAKCQSV